MVRVTLSGLLGGLIIFIWGFLSHVMLPIGAMGMEADMLPGEAAFLATVNETVPDSGMYFMPGHDQTIADSQEQWDDTAARMKQGPTVFMIVQKDGTDAMSVKQLGFEFATNILGAFLAALLLRCMVGPYLCRVLIVMSLGIFAWLAVDLSYWIWYGFSTPYLFAQLIDHTVGWFLAGLLIALLVKPCTKCAVEGGE